MKDSNRDFPVGKGLAVVKWKLGSTNEAVVPLASELELSLFRVGVERVRETRERVLESEKRETRRSLS